MADSNGNVTAALKYLDKNFDDFKRTLIEQSRIPSISAEGFPPEEVRQKTAAQFNGDPARSLAHSEWAWGSALQLIEGSKLDWRA